MILLIPLNSDAAPEFRAQLAVEALKLVTDEIEFVAAHLTPEQMEKIDAAESRLALLRAGTKQRMSLRSLCGKFGNLKLAQDQGAAP